MPHTPRWYDGFTAMLIGLLIWAITGCAPVEPRRSIQRTDTCPPGHGLVLVAVEGVKTYLPKCMRETEIPKAPKYVLDQ